MKSHFGRLVLLAAVMFVSSYGYANQREFVITLRVTFVDQRAGCTPTPSVVQTTFGCGNSIGNVHVGRFSIDDALLQQSGDNLPGSIVKFFLEISPTTWDQATFDAVPGITAFDGFRGPILGNNCPVPQGCLHAPSPGFNVHDGIITGLQGGVFGVSDVPFVDFKGAFFSAIDIHDTLLQGTLQVTPVPAQQGLLDAPLPLQRMYRDAQAVPRSWVSGHVWMNLAAGNEMQLEINRHWMQAAHNERNELSTKMTAIKRRSEHNWTDDPTRT